MVHLKIVWMVNFMLFIVYHDKKRWGVLKGCKCQFEGASSDQIRNKLNKKIIDESNEL